LGGRWRREEDPNFDDLAKIVAAWPSLPAAIRRAILALIS
jgi:hypothetical protein